MLDEPRGIGGGELADRPDTERFEPRARLRADPVDLSWRQRPDATRDVLHAQQREPVGLVELGGHLGEKLVGRHTDRARKPGRYAHGLANRLRDFAGAPPWIADGLGEFAVGGDRMHIGEIDVDLVDAVVLDLRRDRAHRRLEQTRVPAVRVEVGRQQYGVGRKLRGLHQAHRRMQADAPAPRRWPS